MFVRSLSSAAAVDALHEGPVTAEARAVPASLPPWRAAEEDEASEGPPAGLAAVAAASEARAAARAFEVGVMVAAARSIEAPVLPPTAPLLAVGLPLDPLSAATAAEPFVVAVLVRPAPSAAQAPVFPPTVPLLPSGLPWEPLTAATAAAPILVAAPPPAPVPVPVRRAPSAVPPAAVAPLLFAHSVRSLSPPPRWLSPLRVVSSTASRAVSPLTSRASTPQQLRQSAVGLHLPPPLASAAPSAGVQVVSLGVQRFTSAPTTATSVPSSASFPFAAVPPCCCTSASVPLHRTQSGARLIGTVTPRLLRSRSSSPAVATCYGAPAALQLLRPAAAAGAAQPSGAAGLRAAMAAMPSQALNGALEKSLAHLRTGAAPAVATHCWPSACCASTATLAPGRGGTSEDLLSKVSSLQRSLDAQQAEQHALLQRLSDEWERRFGSVVECLKSSASSSASSTERCERVLRLSEIIEGALECIACDSEKVSFMWERFSATEGCGRKPSERHNDLPSDANGEARDVINLDQLSVGGDVGRLANELGEEVGHHRRMIDDLQFKTEQLQEQVFRLYGECSASRCELHHHVELLAGSRPPLGHSVAAGAAAAGTVPRDSLSLPPLAVVVAAPTGSGGDAAGSAGLLAAHRSVGSGTRAEGFGTGGAAQELSERLQSLRHDLGFQAEIAEIPEAKWEEGTDLDITEVVRRIAERRERRSCSQSSADT
mmetsp:Transcript_7674/g.28119  ORF Transcript_7674/g.28119 Transcript_7674/m.28119 type:complete len:714 (+) Transcript_7674:68-2209(+)